MKKFILYSVIFISSIFFAYPFIWMFFATIKPEAELTNIALIPSHLSLDSYKIVFSKIPIMRAFLNSLFVSGVVTFSVNVIGAIAGYVLSRMDFKGRKLILALMLFSMMLPFHILLIPLYVFIVKIRLTDTYLALILPGMSSIFAILMYKQFFTSIPQSLIDAARIDGCSHLRIIFGILIPISKPVVITVSIITFMGIWNDVLWPLIVIREKTLMTMPQMVTLFATGGAAQSIGPKLAAAFLLALPVIVVYAFFQKYFISSIAHTGMKE